MTTTIETTSAGGIAAAVAPPALYWSGPLAIEDAPTGDGRRVMPDALTWRDLPLPLMFQSKTPEGAGNPHAGAELAGRMTLIWRDDDTVYGAGPIDTGEAGANMARFLEDGPLGISVDLDDVDAVQECLAVDEMGDCTDAELQLVKGRVMGATACAFPAIPAAHISLVSAEEYATLTTEHGTALAVDPEAEPHEFEDSGDGTCVVCGKTEDEHTAMVAGAGISMPPESWFQPFTFEHLTPFTISDERLPDGRRRVYGHIAPRDACHIGYPGLCKTMPRGLRTDEFNEKRGATRVACDCGNGDWAEIPTGVVTFGTSHLRDLSLSIEDAMDHYERTGMAICDVVAAVDEFGPAVFGATKLGVTDEQIELMRGAAVSADVRPLRGAPHLAAVLAVNVPGLGVPRQAFHVKDGEVTALVASGLVMEVGGEAPAEAVEDDGRERMERLAKILEPVALAQIAQRFATPAADLTPKERDKLNDKGQALPDGSYPIRNREDLQKAIASIGRAGPKGSDRYAQVKRWIMRRARELNAENLLPEDWKS